tara:strand:+ start:777 stop:1463 length:687 start_codon:yes stop_codon:yes gene_type:complete
LKKEKILITGSEGLIGSKLKNELKNHYEILCLDLKLGHDLNNASFVENWFKGHKNIYGLIICHAFNPLPTKGAKKIEPIDQSLEELRNYFEVNTISVFNICSNYIRNNKAGTIINISSLYGVLSPNHKVYNDFVKPIGYSLSKSSVIMLSKYLATYYAPDFRINTVIFGGIYEESFDKKFVSNYNKNVPFGRMMNIDEVDSIFKFLLDKKNTYVTGAEFIIDGGWTAW